MKPLNNGDLFKSQAFVKFLLFFFISVTFFYLGKHYSDNNNNQALIFYSSKQSPLSFSVTLSPNLNKQFNISSIINDTVSGSEPETAPGGSVTDAKNSPPPETAPAPPVVQRMGVIDENGVMNDTFEVGEFDSSAVEEWESENRTESVEGESGGKISVKKFGVCDMSMRDYIPCLDNVEVIRSLESSEKGEKFERHCPEKGKELNCLVPSPKGYRTPIPWPRSRDEVRIQAIIIIIDV